ncbi:hypothetical protein Droror1_Dr00010298 [Drosera rotundifolia]
MIATPLPPKQTFLDDPFHVLRAVHFGTRFEFTSDKALEQAAACDEVRAAIRDKISWEPLELNARESVGRPFTVGWKRYQEHLAPER